ncbi:hypothetical protein K490DRAFT_67041 [Saccharata proteae CBS 121410]|uniref:Pentatricopeptide repeat protein n=1 Tax=Saccharata proteae CBS 121410 TaxID=1314787 RepID=A0A9P4HSX3_9PEZI|nr:hypothetical protein K490DRAFT_67041 [Saccharata proteae CBS 121410]
MVASRGNEGLEAVDFPEIRAAHRTKDLMEIHGYDKKQILQALRMPTLRPPVKLSSDLETSWEHDFARIHALYDVRLPPEVRTAYVGWEPIHWGPTARIIVDSIDNIVGSIEDMIEGDEDLSEEAIKHIGRIWNKHTAEFLYERKRRTWQNVLLLLLHQKPRYTLDFLIATSGMFNDNVMAVADAMLHLSRIPDGPNFEDPERFHQVFHDLIQRTPQLVRTLSQGLIVNMLQMASLEQIQALWGVKTYFSKWTLCYFAHRFGGYGDTGQALVALNKSLQYRISPNSKLFLSLCSHVLRKSTVNRDAYQQSSQTLSAMLEMGVKLDRILYNIIMHNAVDAGDFPTALQIYELILEKGLQPDEYTFTILTKGLKGGGDNDTLRRIISAASEAFPHLKERNFLATEILHCVYLRFLPRNPEEAFDGLVKTYSRFFDVTPLQNLGIIPGPPSVHDYEVSEAALGIMIIAYVRLIAVNDEDLTHQLYERYMQMPRIHRTHAYNAFLLAYTAHKETLHLVPTVLQDMAASSETHDTLPNQHTWSILVAGFMRHGQPQAAGQFWKKMKEVGGKANAVTWDTLIQGYVAKQDADSVLDALREMISEGVDMEEHTMRAVGRLKEYDWLMKELGIEKRDESSKQLNAPTEDDEEDGFTKAGLDLDLEHSTIEKPTEGKEENALLRPRYVMSRA